jgi:hypothetical protein
MNFAVAIQGTNGDKAKSAHDQNYPAQKLLLDVVDAHRRIALQMSSWMDPLTNAFFL